MWKSVLKRCSKRVSRHTMRWVPYPSLREEDKMIRWKKTRQSKHGQPMSGCWACNVAVSHEDGRDEYVGKSLIDQQWLRICMCLSWHFGLLRAGFWHLSTTAMCTSGTTPTRCVQGNCPVFRHWPCFVS